MNKKLLAGLLLAATMVACSPKIEKKSYNEGINVIPVPVELTQNEGLFTLTANTTLVVTSPEAAQSAAYLAAKIKGSTGYDLTLVQEKPAANYIEIGVDPSLGLASEGYTLNSTQQGVTIAGQSAVGAFYGVQTLLQLLPAEIESPEKITNTAWEIPAVSVRDYPRFEYRGLMIDPCRHFVSVEFLKKQLDVMAMYKINRFHWHLTDDQGWRIEIKKYPLLTEKGAVRTEGDGSQYGPFFYTQDQIREVVAYATERYIDVIPEIELPGHGMAALSGYPEYSCTGGPFTPRIIWGVEDEVFCVGKDATFKFLEDIITEVVALFPSQYFHIGGDECPKVRWAKCADCQARAKELGLKEMTDKNGVKHSVEEQLQSYAVKRIEKHVSSLGKKMIGWDEILEGGLAPGAIVMSWRGVEGGLAAANQDHQVIMSPNPAGLYIDHYQGAAEVEPTTIGGYSPLHKIYFYEPIPADLPADKHHLILGAQANMWAEYRLSEPDYEYMIYPRLMSLAEMTWSPVSRKDSVDFSRRILNAYVRLDYHNINYHIPMPEGVLTQNVVFIGDSTELVFNNTRNLPMVYTVDGTEPTAKSTQYTTPIVIKDENAVVKIATLLPSGKMSGVRSIPVDRKALAPAVNPVADPKMAKIAEKIKATKEQTIRVRTAKGLFPTEAEYANAQFGEDTLVSKFHGGVAYDFNKPSLSIYEGYVELPEDGVYTFTTDMNELWIDGVQLINNNKVLSRHYRNKVQHALAAGKHQYRIVVNNMVKDGWPISWNEVGFQFKAPSSTEFVRATPEMISY